MTRHYEDNKWHDYEAEDDGTLKSKGRTRKMSKFWWTFGVGFVLGAISAIGLLYLVF